MNKKDLARAYALEEGLRSRVDPDFSLADRRGSAVPFVLPSKPLGRATVALVSSGGFHLAGEATFDTTEPMGDPGYRVIPREARREDLAIAHTHYDHRYVDRDLNVALPLDRLEEMEAEGRIGASAQEHVSFMGYCLRTEVLSRQTSVEVAHRFLERGVDAVILAPT